MSVAVAVTGATGRMGGTVVETARERGDVRVGVAIARDPGRASVGTVPVESPASFERNVDDRDVDVLVDFTAPESSLRYVESAARAGVASVVGTTGFDEDGERALRDYSERAPVLHASNFAPGVQALLSAVESAVRTLPDYDVELTETHHRGKRDAPSGTARTILETVAGVRDDARAVHGREGEAPRSEREVGVHARRAGSITGEHEVLLAGGREELRLSHRAGDRGVFAEGALDAAVGLAGREPGWYEFGAVLEGDG